MNFTISLCIYCYVHARATRMVLSIECGALGNGSGDCIDCIGFLISMSPLIARFLHAQRAASHVEYVAAGIG